MNSHSKNSESGFALIATIILLLFIGLALSAGMVGVDSQMRLQNIRLNSQESFYSAEAGVSSAITQIRQDPGLCLGVTAESFLITDEDGSLYRDSAQTDLLGQFTVSVIDGEVDIASGWNTCWIQSVGLNGWDGLGLSPRTLYVRVSLQDPSSFMTSTMGDLTVGEGANINANILSKNVTLDPGESQITFSNNDDGIAPTVFFLQDNFIVDSENGSIVGGYNLEQMTAFTFPVVDNNYFRNKAQELVATGEGVYQGGDLTVNLANLEGFNPNNDGTDFNPRIIFAEGDITIQGEYASDILIVSGGNINITGNITAGVNDSLLRDPQIGLLASGDVLIPNGALGNGDDLTIEAFIMADGQGDADGIFEVESGGDQLGTLTFNGSMAVRGQGDRVSAIDMSAFANRQYSFNEDFNTNRSIPFLPFSVNIIEWREIENPELEPFPPATE